VIELRDLDDEILVEHINIFHRALTIAMSDEVSSIERQKAQERLRGVLEWLWRSAAGPVLEALGIHDRPNSDDANVWPRIWWAPGGLMSLLPIHAAGYHAEAVTTGGHRTVMDRVVSSYTPTVRALRDARHRTAQRPDTVQAVRGLIVAMPTTPGMGEDGELPHAHEEVDAVRRRIPEHTLLLEPTLSDAATTDLPPTTPIRSRVLEHLSGCEIAHFLCHGTSQPVDPSQSRLLLHDHQRDPLTVASLDAVRLDEARLVFLSACSTSAAHRLELIDEAIHLTSAFQIAGFPHAVGTLWKVDDRVSVKIADAFYGHLHEDGQRLDLSRAAWALHQAVRTVRDFLPLTPSLWAAYLHAGA
jgi:hypothetical protein